MKRTRVLGRAVSIALLLVLAAAGWAAPSPSPQGEKVPVDGGFYTNVPVSVLAAMLKAKDFFFVNTHIPYQGEIAATDAFLPFDRTTALLTKYPSDKAAKIVLYCRSGRMSDITARELVKAGYTNVFNLSGGMIAWQKAGLPLIDKGN